MFVGVYPTHYQSKYILLYDMNFQLYSALTLSQSNPGDANDVPDFGMESAGCALSHHTFTCAKARLSTRVCLANGSYHSRSRKWRDAPSNGIHLPKWRLFRHCHFGRVVRRDTLPQCWPRSMMPPGCLILRGCECYDKNPFPKIDSPLAFHPPIALPSNIAFHK